jgi:hypothetical protein
MNQSDVNVISIVIFIVLLIIIVIGMSIYELVEYIKRLRNRKP